MIVLEDADLGAAADAVVQGRLTNGAGQWGTGPGAIDGLILATGHFRNGVLLAPVTADAVAALLAGEQPAADLEAFAPGRFRSPRPARLASEARG